MTRVILRDVKANDTDYTGDKQPMTHLTFDQVNTGLTCLRKAQLQYEYGIRRAPTIDTGASIARAIKHGVRLMAESMPAEEAAFMAAALCEDSVSRQVVMNMLCGYHQRWGNVGGDVLMTGIVYTLPVLNPDTGAKTRVHELHGRIQRIVELDSGKIAIVDTRTTTSDTDAPTSNYWQRHSMDARIGAAILGAREMGWSVDCVVLDVIKVPSIRGKKLTIEQTRTLVDTGVYLDEPYDVTLLDGGIVQVNDEQVAAEQTKNYFTITETPGMVGARIWREIMSAPNDYYKRKEVYRTQAELDDMTRDIYQMDRVFHFCRSNEFWPPNTASCIGFGTCPMLPLCNAGYKHGDPLPEGFTINHTGEID